MASNGIWWIQKIDEGKKCQKITVDGSKLKTLKSYLILRTVFINRRKIDIIK
jgi:hypothetical protein